MENLHSEKNNQEFDELLTKFQERNSSEEEIAEDELEFLEKYIWTEDAEDFGYVEKAAERGYARAYAPLADRYASEKGCAEDWAKAFQYWNLSVQHGLRGYADIGDCYRLGKGTEKDYDKAWAAYEKAVQKDESEGFDDIPFEELLLTSSETRPIEQKEIELDWLKYALKKQTKLIPNYIYGAIASSYFEYESEDYLYWVKLGADAGNVGCKCTIFKHTQDETEKAKLIQEIFNSDDYSGGGYDMAADLAKEIIDNASFEKQAFRFLYEEEANWLFEHYKKVDRENDLAALLYEFDQETKD